MGERGPVNKRSDQVRRRNTPKVPVDHAPAAGKVEIPEPDESWHPVAKRWYLALAESGQSLFYEPSDWATAYLVAESMSRELHPQYVCMTEGGEVVKEKLPLRGASLTAYLRAMTALLVTEGDRRRSRLELERAGAADPDEEASVTAISEYVARITS